MSRFGYWVIDPTQAVTRFDADGKESAIFVYADQIRLHQVLGPDDVFDPPEWVRHGVEHKGWRVIQRELPESGLNDMGHVNWRTVAESLAAALEAVTQQEDLDDPEPAEKASQALDDYQIAQHEAALREGPEVQVREDEG